MHRAAVYEFRADPDDPRRLDRCHAAAHTRGLTVVATFTDHGPRWRQDRRPGLQRLRRAMRAGAFDALLVPDLASILCSSAHAIRLLVACGRAGVRLIAVAEGLDTGTVERAVVTEFAKGVLHAGRVLVSERLAIVMAAPGQLPAHRQPRRRYDRRARAPWLRVVRGGRLP